jgi:hypothetical protein
MKYIKRHIRKIELFFEVIFLGYLFLVGLFLEYDLAVSLLWQFYLVMAGFSLILLLPVYLQYRRKQELWLFLGFNISLLALYFVTLSPVKPFTKFYLDVKNGMKVEEVQGLFKEHFPQDGKFRQPEWSLNDSLENIDSEQKGFVTVSDQHLNYILDPNDGRYNAEILIVYFQDGKVVKTKYLPD